MQKPPGFYRPADSIYSFCRENVSCLDYCIFFIFFFSDKVDPCRLGGGVVRPPLPRLRACNSAMRCLQHVQEYKVDPCRLGGGRPPPPADSAMRCLQHVQEYGNMFSPREEPKPIFTTGKYRVKSSSQSFPIPGLPIALCRNMNLTVHPP